MGSAGDWTDKHQIQRPADHVTDSKGFVGRDWRETLTAATRRQAGRCYESATKLRGSTCGNRTLDRPE